MFYTFSNPWIGWVRRVSRTRQTDLIARTSRTSRIVLLIVASALPLSAQIQQPSISPSQANQPGGYVGINSDGTVAVGTTVLDPVNGITTSKISSSGSLTLSATQVLLPDGTSSNPAIAFASAPSKGFYYLSGTIYSTAPLTGMSGNITSAGYLYAGSSYGIGIGSDTFLYRDAANIFAQRNGTSAQAFRIYNTWTDATDYEAALFGWTSNQFQIMTTKSGTGVARQLFLSSASGSISINSSITFNADNTYNIGASEANRPANIYVGTSVVTPTITISGSSFSFAGKTCTISAGTIACL